MFHGPAVDRFDRVSQSNSVAEIERHGRRWQLPGMIDGQRTDAILKRCRAPNGTIGCAVAFCVLVDRIFSIDSADGSF